MDEESITAFPLDGTVESQPNMSETVQLDPEGDAVLSIKGSDGDKSYLVSSRVLSLASPVFSKMFGPNFKEGQEIRRGDCPRISLEEDDPEAMGLILSILHYKCAQVPLAMEPKELATLAMHADKYYCNEALRPWASQWCSNMKEVTAPEDHGFMLLAAYMFRSPSFSEIASRAVRQLTPNFASIWEKHEELALLPETITDTLSDQIAGGLRELHQLLQSTEVRLREQKACHSMYGLICSRCGRTLPGEAKKCHPCCNTDLLTKTCTSDHRVAEYFETLTRCELWPSLKPFTATDLSGIQERFQYARGDHKHLCGAGETCPLVRVEVHDAITELVHHVLCILLNFQ
ncbi:uncharacterized protein TRIREDRAFT_111124 [Trichoderma reesei QM6a]|uniref:Predicted protein n=1 Tax=Hypocrea jecorina (strain QM6a) TaxID=431241 RepID=G0RTT8_HYPJQ|nr:uncharacterized protein TRIREDRAFT_111124 [Trichoderma reesei QM6a]EGR45491.1 predicted protein [Trichoderma reesei QM6a]